MDKHSFVVLLRPGLYWCIKTLWWEGIMCSQESKQVFVSKRSRKTFVCHLILQVGKIKCRNRGEMTNLHLKSPWLKVSDSCSWDSTKPVCALDRVNTEVFACSVILQSSNASSEKHSNVEKSPLHRTFIWQYSTTKQLLLHRVVYSRALRRLATLFPWHFASSDWNQK